MKYCPILLLLIALFFFSGCGGQQPLPVGWPSTVVPCSITLTKGGTPFDGAKVTLIPATGGGNWVVSGTTNANGVAEIFTTCSSMSKSGAPLGDFKITVSKWHPPMSDPTPKATLDAMSYEERTAHYKKLEEEGAKRPPLVSTKLSDLNGTPLSVSVQGKTAVTIHLDEYM